MHLWSAESGSASDKLTGCWLDIEMRRLLGHVMCLAIHWASLDLFICYLARVSREKKPCKASRDLNSELMYRYFSHIYWPKQVTGPVTSKGVVVGGGGRNSCHLLERKAAKSGYESSMQTCGFEWL